MTDLNPTNRPPNRWLGFDIAGEAERWRSVNDGVMGGVSAGRFAIREGRGVFSGTLSLDQGGGFASVRREVSAGTLAGSEGAVIHLRGDGRRYQCRVGSPLLPAGASYAAGFETTVGRWSSVRLRWSGFRGVRRGRHLPDAPDLQPDGIERFGFLIAERQAGLFCLEIEAVDWF